MPQVAIPRAVAVKPPATTSPDTSEFNFSKPSTSPSSGATSRYRGRRKKPQSVLMIVGGIFGVMIFGCCGFGILAPIMFPESAEQKAQREARVAAEREREAERERIAEENAAVAYQTRDNSNEAYRRARDAVKQRLKSPSTAEFPSMFGGEWEAHTTRGSDGERVTYKVKSWVDAQNSFGATVRTHWSATVTQWGNGYNDWTVTIDSM